MILAAACVAATWGFSVPEPPYSIDRREEDGAKAVPTVNADEIRIGNRKVRLTKAIFGVMANGLEIASVDGYVSVLKNWVPVQWQVTPMKDGKGVHRVWKISGELTTDGQPVTVESDVRVMPNGEIEFKVFNPGANPNRGLVDFRIVVLPELFYDQLVSVNGSVPFRLAPNAREFVKSRFPEDAKMPILRYGGDVKFSFLSPDGKTPRLTIRYGENCSGGGFQCGDPKRVILETRMVDSSKPLTI